MAPRLRRDEYMVGWVVALPMELEAAVNMLDEEHDTPLSDTLMFSVFDDDYTYGRVGEHNVVIAYDLTGISSANTIVQNMKRLFKSLRFGLMLGVGGGVPSKEADIRLGDVVVGSPCNIHGGVVQYNSSQSGGFVHTGSLDAPPPVLLDAVSNLQADHKNLWRKIGKNVSAVRGMPSLRVIRKIYPDRLYAAGYGHQGEYTCGKCDKSYLVDREPRSEGFGGEVHYGTIASGDQAMKSGIERDKLSLELGGVLCFETEIAGLTNNFPCLVVRGICDYADSHKNVAQWRGYALRTATAYAKELLSVIPRANVARMKPVDEAMRELSDPRAGRETSQIQELWKKPVSGREYRNITDFINEIAADSYINFDSITWEWKLPAILASDVESDVVLVCTSPRTHAPGDFANVHASTYWEYLKQSKWAEFIKETLDILDQVKLDMPNEGFCMSASTNPPVWITCHPSHLSINFSNRRTCLEFLDLIEVLDWVCKSLCNPTNESGHVVSSALYGFEHLFNIPSSLLELGIISIFQPPKMRPIVKLETSPLPEIQHSCWLSLFKSCIVVDSSFTPHAGFGKGLETSFDLMIALANANSCLKIKDSFVFLGYRTLLYPVAIDRNCAQFHLITTTHGQIDPYTLDLDYIIPVQDSSQFKTMRCFIGWCEDAHIYLGTEHLSAKIEFTGGRDHPRSLKSDGYTFVSQVGVSSILQFLFGIEKNYTYSRHHIQFSPAEDYRLLLWDASQQPVVLYDLKQGRFWLVPKLNLLLHMAQRDFSCSAGGVIPYAEPQMSTNELISLLERAGEINVLLQKGFLRLNISILQTTHALLKSSRGKLYGFEFEDIVRHTDRGACMKRFDIQSQGNAWPELVNAVGTVIVCSGLGEVILPKESIDRKCQKCNKVPENKGYFVATVPCLLQLLERQGTERRVGSIPIKIADKTEWRLEGNPFIPCNHGESSKETCWERPGLIQQVVQRGISDRAIRSLQLSRRQPVQQPPVQSPPVQSLPETAAVVFS